MGHLSQFEGVACHQQQWVVTSRAALLLLYTSTASLLAIHWHVPGVLQLGPATPLSPQHRRSQNTPPTHNPLIHHTKQEAKAKLELLERHLRIRLSTIKKGSRHHRVAADLYNALKDWKMEAVYKGGNKQVKGIIKRIWWEVQQSKVRQTLALRGGEVRWLSGSLMLAALSSTVSGRRVCIPPLFLTHPSARFATDNHHVCCLLLPFVCVSLAAHSVSMWLCAQATLTPASRALCTLTPMRSSQSSAPQRSL